MTPPAHSPPAATRQEAVAGVTEAVRRDPRLRERAVRELRPREKLWLGLEIVAAYIRVRRTISALPLPEVLVRLRRGVTDSGVPAAEAPGEHVTVVRLARATQRTLHRLPGDTRCLTQSLVLTVLIARRGIGSNLRIAVAPGEDFMAHAWIEHGGVPVLPPESSGFRQLVEL